MKITWYGHACFAVETENATVVFDPYSPEKVPGLKLPLLSADMVISSHDHADHFCPQAVKLLKRRVDVKMTQLHTFHDEVRGKKRGQNIVTVVELDGCRVAHMGDLGHMLSAEEVESLGRLDVMMIPMGGHYTINAAEARQIADAVNSFITIPMHYRGEGFGYDVISTVDEFAALSPNTLYWDSNVLELGDIKEQSTVILKCPVN